MKVVRVQVTPPKAAAVAAVAVVVVLTVARIQKATASSRAKRERRTRKKIPVGITAPRVSDKSRVKRPPLGGAGRPALMPDRSGLKRSPEITDKQGRRGDGAGVETATQRKRSSWRKVKTERDTTAGTGRDQAAPSPPWTGVGAAREAGRTEVKTGVTVEMVRGTEAAQTEGRAEQQMREGKKERAGEGAGARGEEKEAKKEPKESTDSFISLSYNIRKRKQQHRNDFFFFFFCGCGCCAVFVNSLLY